MTGTAQAVTTDPGMDQAASDGISSGDREAMRGRWEEALAAWTKALSNAESDAAASRIRWLIDQSVEGEFPPKRERRLRKTALRWIVSLIGAGAIGTGTVLYNLDRTGREAGVLSGIAWLFYLLAMSSAVMYALEIGRASEAEPLTADDLIAARQIANHLGTSAAPYTEIEALNVSIEENSP